MYHTGGKQQSTCECLHHHSRTYLKQNKERTNLSVRDGWMTAYIFVVNDTIQYTGYVMGGRYFICIRWNTWEEGSIPWNSEKQHEMKFWEMDVKEGEKRDSYLRKKRGFGIQPMAVANEDDFVIWVGVQCYIECKLEKKRSLPTV